jgi:hypothetical protein
MFTTGGRRLIVRGNNSTVPISPTIGQQLANQNWRWSAHTQPGVGRRFLTPSEGDIRVLTSFPQSRSLILNSTGEWQMFNRGGTMLNNWTP